MPINVDFGRETIFGFLLTLTRVGSGLLILPLAGIREASKSVRIALVATVTICLFPVWPAVTFDTLAGGAFLMAILGETAFGLILGLAMALLNETFQVAAQMVAMQTGFSFASTIDPTSQADTNVFQQLTQLLSGFLFFAFGVHLQLLRLFSRSFDVFSPGQTYLHEATLQTLLQTGAAMLITGFKLGLPVVTLLLLVDLSLAVLNRLQAQLQLMTLASPAKVALSFLFLAAAIVRWPGMYQEIAAQVVRRLATLIGP